MDNKNKFLNAGLAGITSRTITSPLERIKILQQIHTKKYKNLNIYNSLKLTIKNEGFKSLFNGNLSNCLRIFPQSAIQYTVFDSTKNYLNNYYKIQNSNIINFSSGSLGGIVSTFTIYPLETIRSKLSAQNNNSDYNGITHCFKKTYKNKGLLGFYKGLNICLLGMIPFQGSNFMTYQYLTNILNKEKKNNSITLINGFLSGFVSVSVSYPFDVIKRKLQLSNEIGNPSYKNTIDCIKYIYKENKIRGFYNGLFACYLKIVPANAIFFFTIEFLNKNLVI